MMKKRTRHMLIGLLIAIGAIATVNAQVIRQTNRGNMEHQNPVSEWDKTFPKSDKVNHRKVSFKNRYGITLVADLYVPKNATGKLPAIAVSGPFGAVKEQASGLYAQAMAERGFLSVAFDPSYTGGKRRYAPLCRFSRYQYRGFQRRCGFPVIA